MRQKFLIRLVLAGVAVALPAAAAEYAVLDTGFRIRAERHEQAGERVRLFLDNGGVIEFPAAQITAFESEDYVAPAAPASPRPVEAFNLDEAVRAIAEEYHLPEDLVHSVIATESAYDPAAVSVKRGDRPDATDARDGARVGRRPARPG